MLRRVSGALFVAFTAFNVSISLLVATTAQGLRDAGGPLLLASAAHAVSTMAMLVAVLSFPGPHRTRREWKAVVLDVLTVAGSGSLVCWYLIVGPVLRLAGHSPTAVVSLASLPVMDLVGACGAVLVLLRGVTAGRRTLTHLIIGNLLVTAPGLYTVYKISHGMATATSPVVGLIMVTGMTLLAVATVDHLAACAHNHETVETSEPLPGISNVPYLAFLAGFALLILAAVQHGTYPWPGLVLGTVLMTSGMGVRQAMTIRDNQRLATIDVMTGVANRMSLTLAMERAIDRAQRTRVPIAVLLFDLDEFKQVNDTLGHDAGDAILTTFAAALRRNVLGTDVVGRLGGDEFAVILNAIRTPQDAVLVAERILADLAEPVTVKGTPVRIHTSIGISLSLGEDSTSGVLQRADAAMYQAKRTRRPGNSAWQVHVDPAEPGRHSPVDPAEPGRQSHVLPNHPTG
jgi:diguanylate cyclase (GGDEF)-like protein